MRGKLKGILFILLAAAGFSLMSVFVRLSGALPVMEKVLFRNLVAAVAAFVMLKKSGERFFVGRGNYFPLFMRSLLGTLGVIANFWAIDHLGIADANMLNKMSPFFAIIMSLLILGERPSRADLSCLVVALCGAALVIKPGTGLAQLPALVGLFGGFAAGTAYTYIRKAGQRGVRGPVIILCFSVFSCLACIPFLLTDFQPMTGRQLLFLLLAGAAATLGQVGITAAYNFAPAKEISVFDYSQVVFAALFGLLFWGELPDRWSVLGYVLIIGTAVYRWNRARSSCTA